MPNVGVPYNQCIKIYILDILDKLPWNFQLSTIYFVFKCNAHGLIPLNGLSVNRFTRSESPRGYIPRVVIIDIEYILYIYGRYAACIRFGSALGAVYTITPAPRLTETLGAVYTITGASQNNWLSRPLRRGMRTSK